MANSYVSPEKLADDSGDTDTLIVLAGLPQNETTFEYLAGCWKRLHAASRAANRLVSISVWHV